MLQCHHPCQLAIQFNKPYSVEYISIGKGISLEHMLQGDIHNISPWNLGTMLFHS